MLSLIKKLSSPLLSFVVLTLAASYMTTFVGMKTKALSADEWLVGAMMSCTYMGMTLGAFKMEHVVTRVGHIRTFAVCASLMASISILHGMHYSPLTWLALRFLTGLSLAGLYVVIEGWLLANSTPRNRGQILSVYMISLYASQSFGQLFLKLSDLDSLLPYLLMALMCSISVVPVALTRAKTPEINETSLLKFSKLYKLSPSGVVGCFIAGMIMSAIYGLAHSYISDIGRGPELPNIMMTLILGGAVIQYPLGWASDHFDKRKVLIVLSSFLVVSSIAIVLIEDNTALNILYYAMVFMFGGTTFTLYTLNIAHACDYVEPKDTLAVVSGLLLSYGVGATTGPLVAPIVMTILGPNGLFMYFILCAITMVSFYSYRSTKRPTKPVEEQVQFVPVVQTTPVAHELSAVVQEAAKEVAKEEKQKKSSDIK